MKRWAAAGMESSPSIRVQSPAISPHEVQPQDKQELKQLWQFHSGAESSMCTLPTFSSWGNGGLKSQSNSSKAPVTQLLVSRVTQSRGSPFYLLSVYLHAGLCAQWHLCSWPAQISFSFLSLQHPDLFWKTDPSVCTKYQLSGSVSQSALPSAIHLQPRGWQVNELG